MKDIIFPTGASVAIVRVNGEPVDGGFRTTWLRDITPLDAGESLLEAVLDRAWGNEDAVIEAYSYDEEDSIVDFIYESGEVEIL